jgi:uncharacterized protein YodC (DUF2158 family)
MSLTNPCRGEVVTISAGGPRMTVEAVATEPYAERGTVHTVPYGYVLCVWFDRQLICRELFSLDVLTAAKMGEGNGR